MLYLPNTKQFNTLTICLLLSISSTQAFSQISMSEPRHIVVIGAGIQGTSVAHHLHRRSSSLPPESTITLLESQGPASAASGKGGGFMARSWGSGSTIGLHELGFDLYEQYCAELNVKSYRQTIAQTTQRTMHIFINCNTISKIQVM
jgi:hypothetical protein